MHFSTGAAATPTPSAMVTVPSNLNGKTVDEVTKELQKVGLTVGSKVSQPSDKVDTGKVIGTDPQAGTQVPAGSNVNLTVSSGKDGGGH